MKLRLFLLATIIFTLVGCGSADSAVLVMSPNGAFVGKSSIYAANVSLDAAGKTIVITSPQTLTENITLATDRVWRFEKGAIITTTGYTLNANGAVVDAEDYRIFAGTGTVTGLREPRAAWWGFDVSASAAVNAAAIQYAIGNFTSTSGGTVKLHRGSFSVAPDVVSIVGKRGVTISGASTGYGYVNSYSGTRLTFTAGTVGINMYDSDAGTLATNSFNNKVQNLTVDGNSVLATGIKVNGNQVIEDVGVTGCTTYGIHLANMTNSAHLFRVSSFANGGKGLYTDGALTTTYSVRDSNFRINTGAGIEIQAGNGVLFDHVVTESNGEEGLKIYRPATTTPVSKLRFQHVWVENNWYGNGTGGDSINIDSATKDYGDGPPNYIIFDTCDVTAAVSGKHLSIESARFVDFFNCNFSSGDTANGMNLDPTYASYVYFYDGEMVTEPTGSTGYLGGSFRKAQVNSTGGFVSDAGMSNRFQRVYHTSGGIVTKVAYATVDVTAASTITIPVEVPAGARLIGAQIRVDSALASGETWNSAYSGGATANIAIGGLGVTKNVKANGLFEYQSSTSVTTDVTNIAITRSAGGNFTAQGSFSGWVYYQTFEAVDNL